MDDAELRELQDPTMWEDEEDAIRPPVEAPRASVAVRFSSAEFQRVASHARQQGMTVSEFIRFAALDRVRADETGIPVGAPPLHAESR